METGKGGEAKPDGCSEDPGQVYRVAFVNTHPIQYFAPLYAYLARHCKLDVTALYLSDVSLRGGHDRGFGQAVTWDVDLMEGYASQFMGSAASKRQIGGFFSMIAPELWPAIRSGGYDAVVIHGHNLAAHHLALAAARFAGSLVFTRGDTHSGLKRPTWRSLVRKPLLTSWYKLFDGALAVGSANARYYRAMGVPDARIFLAPFAVDNQRFIDPTRPTGEVRDAVRARLGLTDTSPAVLYAAKFDRRKRPGDVVLAFHMLQNAGVKAQLVMVGSGALEAELRAMVTELGVKHVVFPGFINQSELPGVYAACDVFVLPSETEPWGLAVNEAMCAGLPIVATQSVGCAEDLVGNGENGAIYKTGDVTALAACLRPILTDADTRARYGMASLERIRSWSYRECGAGLREAIHASRLRRFQKRGQAGSACTRETP